MNKIDTTSGTYMTIIEVCDWIRSHRSHPVATQLVRVTSEEEMLALYATVKDE